jgi:thiosulfate dehydrogenase [quinone] large subunit
MNIMAVHDDSHRHPGLRLSFPRRTGSDSVSATATSEAAATTTAGTHALAGVRVLLGFVFLWAFLDKTFGFGYATPSGRGWLDGGSPTKGFLGSVAVGPMESTFHAWAGATWADWLFMLGLLGLGVALIAGIGLRIAAVAGTAMMALMWMAEWPPARHLSDGSASMSSNPFVDYHLVYAVALIALAATGAGATWGLGRLWARLPFVSRNRWLL